MFLREKVFNAKYFVDLQNKNNKMELIENKWYKRDGACVTAIEKIEKSLNVTFSEQYKIFLSWSNGGEGVFGNNYIYIWAIEDVITYNNDYRIQKFLQKDYLAFGMDGDVGYVFYLPDHSIYRVDFGDLDLESIKFVASSFAEFLGKALYVNFNKL